MTGADLRHLMDEHGTKPDDLARFLGVDRMTIYNLRKATSIKLLYEIGIKQYYNLLKKEGE